MEILVLIFLPWKNMEDTPFFVFYLFPSLFWNFYCRYLSFSSLNLFLDMNFFSVIAHGTVFKRCNSFLLVRQIYREKDMQRERFSVLWLEPNKSKARSQQIFPDLQGRCRVPRLWAVLDCLPKPQAGNWRRNGAASTQIHTHMGSWSLQGKDLAVLPSHLAGTALTASFSNMSLL